MMQKSVREYCHFFFRNRNFNQKHISIACGRSRRFVASFANTEETLGSKRRNCSFMKHASNGYSHENPFLGNKSSSDTDFVQAVWVFHRHGDRTPARSLVPDHMYEEEASFWQTKIPPQRSYHDAFNCNFPTIGKQTEDFIDAQGDREPYGFLTYRGMDQMRLVGQRLAHRYQTAGKSDIPFWEDWDVHAYSTDYLRTVKSVQCFLDGLLLVNKLHNNDNHADKSNRWLQRTSFENMSVEDYRDNHINHDVKDANIQVEIRDRNIDTLNAFDRDPDLMKQLVTEVVETEHFLKGDLKAASLAARLANYLPGLTKRSKYGGPSGINWIHAADHFVCRSSHGLNFSAFTSSDLPTNQDSHQGDPEFLLEAMSHQTVAHLAWRFHQWYNSLPLLAEIAAPPLREIERLIQATPSLGVERRKPFIIYSCHDVTILSLLYAIGASFLKEQQSAPYWPTYASTLIFELIRTSNPKEMFRIRILLNGKPISIQNQSTENQQQTSVSLSEFSQIISDLEGHMRSCPIKLTHTKENLI